MEQGFNKNAAISALTRSPHGDLAQYAPIGVDAAAREPEFFSRLIAWNDRKGQIRDAKVALPVLALTAAGVMQDAELRENALAHIVRLDPRNLVRALRFAKSQPVHQRRRLARTVEQYLREREANPGRFERTALQHRGSLKELYALLHIKPGEYAQKILFDGAKVGVFADVARLKDMDPMEAAGVIMRKRIPFLTAQGALGAKMKDPAVVQALIGAMSATELVTNTKMLERLGVKTNPALRATFEAGLQKVADSGQATLKTTRAADAVGGATGEKLRGAQEKQIDKIAVEGDWAILADCSPSMKNSLDVGRKIADFLARAAKGRVHLVWFNDQPRYFDVTGKAFDEIVELTKRIVTGGGTNIGCGLDYLLQKKIEVDGIAVVSDGGDGARGFFSQVHKKYEALLGKDLPVYFYRLAGDPDTFSGQVAADGIQMTKFDLTGGVDYYSLPNIVATMRTNRYSLVDEIMATPLLKLSDVFRSNVVVVAAPELEVA